MFWINWLKGRPEWRKDLLYRTCRPDTSTGTRYPVLVMCSVVPYLCSRALRLTTTQRMRVGISMPIRVFVLILLGLLFSAKGLADVTGWEGLGFENLRGEQESLQHYRGRVVVLNFWATWCDRAARRCLCSSTCGRSMNREA